MIRRSLILPAAAGAVLLTMMSLMQVFERQAWFVPSVLAVGTAFGAGWLARRLDVPAVLAPAVSLLALLTYIGIVFLSETTMAGLPTAATMEGIGHALSVAGRDIRELSPPAEPTEALTLLATGGVFLVAMAVDAIVFWLRRPVAAGLPLLALFLIPTSMADHPNVAYFVLAAAGFLGLLVAEGRDRARSWGRRLSGMDLADDVADVSHVARVGRRIGSAAVFISLCVPLAVPSVGKGILTGDGGLIGRGRGARTATVINPIVEIKAQLQSDVLRNLLYVRTETPEYLRLTSLDAFDGQEWSLVKRDVKPDHRVGKKKQIPLPQEFGRIQSTLHRYEVAVDSLAVRWLPIPYAPSRVDVSGDWRYEDFGLSVFSAERTTRDVHFVAEARLPEPSTEELRAEGEIPSAIRDQYTSLPAFVPPIAQDTLTKVVGTKTNPYDIAVALNEFFYVQRPGGFRYDLDVRAGNNTDALTDFLVKRRGYCEQFAATMAYLARLARIPARVVVGFTPGTLRNDGTYVVTNKDAHAWPELYFAETGWVRFEPTPRTGTDVPPYATRGQTPPGGEAPPGETPPTSPTRPTATPSNRPPNLDTANDTVGDPRNPFDTAGRRGGRSGVSLAALVLAVAVALLVLPTVVAFGTRRRRRRHADSPAGRIHAAWESLADAAEDAGFPLRSSDSPRGAARRLVASASLAEGVATEVARLASAEERARYALSVPPVDGLDAGVRTVRRALLASLPKRSRLRAAVFPASAVRRIAEGLRATSAAVDRLRDGVRGRVSSGGARARPDRGDRGRGGAYGPG